MTHSTVVFKIRPTFHVDSRDVSVRFCSIVFIQMVQCFPQEMGAGVGLSGSTSVDVSNPQIKTSPLSFGQRPAHSSDFSLIPLLHFRYCLHSTGQSLNIIFLINASLFI